MSESESQEVISQMNRKYNEFNVMKIRLDTEPLLKEIETYLRGSKTVFIQTEDGNVSNKKMSFGYPKANEIGIQSIMSWLSLLINPHTVQGNFSSKNGFSDEFQDFMYHFQVDFGEYIMINLYEFNIKESEYMGIVRSIRSAVERFLSRSIDNLERDSYGETTRSIESNTIANKGGNWGIFGAKS